MTYDTVRLDQKARVIEDTDPIARKNENVAALLSMYCESVARNPRGPAPPLEEEFEMGSVEDDRENTPQDTPRPKDKTNSETNATAHKRTHSRSKTRK